MLIIATNNNHKLDEYKKILGNNISIKCIKDFNIDIDPKEDGNSLIENAFIKAKCTYDELLSKGLIDKNDFVVADDTGLFIEYLDNAPGIYSARFLSPLKQSEKNRIIVNIMKDVVELDKRKAYFKTIIFLISDNINKAFEGRVLGYISDKISGNEGFGYDSIFIPESFIKDKKTYADIGNIKNEISHRRLAINNLLKFLESEE